MYEAKMCETKIDKFSIIAVDFNILPSIIHRTYRRQISNYI